MRLLLPPPRLHLLCLPRMPATRCTDADDRWPSAHEPDTKALGASLKDPSRRNPPGTSCRTWGFSPASPRCRFCSSQRNLGCSLFAHPRCTPPLHLCIAAPPNRCSSPHLPPRPSTHGHWNHTVAPLSQCRCSRLAATATHALMRRSNQGKSWGRR
jgi:hypothetical protein